VQRGAREANEQTSVPERNSPCTSGLNLDLC